MLNVFFAIAALLAAAGCAGTSAPMPPMPPMDATMVTEQKLELPELLQVMP